MSQNNDDKSTPARPASDSGLPKRPVPTIDLKATEIKADTKSAAATSSVPPTGAPGVTKPAEAKPQSSPSSGGPSSPAKPDAKAGAGPASAVPPIGGASKAGASPAAGDTKPEAPKPGAPRSPRGFGIGRALSYASAAVLGGLIALFGADLIASSLGIDVRPGGAPTSAVEDLTTRLARLEKSGGTATAAATQGLSAQLSQANERIAKLEGANRQMAALSEAQSQLAGTVRALEEKSGQGAASGASPEVAGRIAKLEETIQGMTALAQSQPGRPIPELARLSSKLQELDQAVAALRKTGGGDAAAQIDARLAEARKAEAQMSEAMSQLKAESTSRLREIEAVKTQAERLEQKVDGVKADAGAARSTVDALKSDVGVQLQTVARQGDLKATVEVVDKKVAGLEGKVDTLAKRDEERQANAERIVAALQLANLKRAMDQGRPYADALAEVEKTAGGIVDVSRLKAFRDKGVPSVTELAGQFRQVAQNVLAAEQDKGQSSTMGRLLQSAKSVVQIRRIGGDVEGDSAEARLARAESNLKAGDLDTAAKEMRALKPELRMAAQAWLDQLDARVMVDRALKSIEDKLKTSVAAPPAAKGAK